MQGLWVPWLAIGLPIAGAVMRVSAAASRDALGDDSVRTARAKGVRPAACCAGTCSIFAIADPSAPTRGATINLMILNAAIVQDDLQPAGLVPLRQGGDREPEHRAAADDGARDRDLRRGRQPDRRPRPREGRPARAARRRAAGGCSGGPPDVAGVLAGDGVQARLLGGDGGVDGRVEAHGVATVGLGLVERARRRARARPRGAPRGRTGRRRRRPSRARRPARVSSGRSASALRRSSASVPAPPRSVPGTMTMNSSPPQRASTSEARARWRRRLAAARRTSSPTSWPNSSLMSLKWSTSSSITENGRPVRRAAVAWRSSTSSTWRRLGREVNGSVVACSASRSLSPVKKSRLALHADGGRRRGR